jgi:hypothetical protein
MLRTAIEQNNDGSGMARMAFLLTTITDELGEELRDVDDMTVRIFLAQIGEVIAWIGHGDNQRLPESVREFAEGVQPTETNVSTPPAVVAESR